MLFPTWPTGGHIELSKEDSVAIPSPRQPAQKSWPAAATSALRVTFGIIWAVDAALTWTPSFAQNFVGYLHNAAQGQPDWLAWWFSMWINLVTPQPDIFIWLTRLLETAIALCLLFGFARKTLYVVGALFSLLIWATAEGFGGPYVVGATNMGTSIAYVLLFAGLIVIDRKEGKSPYSLDFYLERRWPSWRRFSEWAGAETLEAEPRPMPWGQQALAMLAIALVLLFLIGGLESSTNVKPPTPANAAAAVSPLNLASGSPIAKAPDATLPPLLGTGKSVNLHITIADAKVEIASGVYYQAWTFGGGVPGPIIHVRQGQTVNVTLTNSANMPHSIDFHAAQVPPNEDYKDIAPGQTLKFSFVAKVPGAFLYHCGTAPVLLHIGNGMYGAIIVDPSTPLPPAAESYVLVQSEWYTRQVSGTTMGPDYQKMLAATPDEVVFNGAAFKYRNHPLPVKAGQRVRLYVVDAGPNLWSSFHVIGAIFDKVYPDGDPSHALSGVSTYTFGPGEGAVFDVIIPQPGKYAFVDHSMAHMAIGAQGILEVQ
jgi:nitrite reductase (NO-forming)